MTHLLLLGLTLLSDPRGSTVDVSGGGVVELRGGRAPVDPSDPPEPSLLAVVSPIARLHWGHRKHNESGVAYYSPRLLYRFPNRLQISRPLLLHQAGLTHQVAMTPTWGTGIALDSTVGEVDYTSTNLLFGDQQGALPAARVSTYATGALALLFTGAVAPSHTLTITPSTEIRAPYGEDAAPPPQGVQETAFLPRQIAGALALGHIHQFSPVDSLITGAGFQYVDFDTRGSAYVVSATVGWGRRITRRLDSTLRAGIFAAQEVRQPVGFTRNFSQGTPVRPLADATLRGQLYSRARLRITGDFGLATNAFLDPVRGDVVPRAGTNAGLLFFTPPRWTMGVTASFFTVATLEPRSFANENDGMMMGGMVVEDIAAQQESVLSWRTPVTVTFRDTYALEFGTLWSVRGPHVRAEPFRFRQLESWVYVSFSVNFATGHAAGGRRQGGGGATTAGGANR